MTYASATRTANTPKLQLGSKSEMPWLESPMWTGIELFAEWLEQPLGTLELSCAKHLALEPEEQGRLIATYGLHRILVEAPPEVFMMLCSNEEQYAHGERVRQRGIQTLSGVHTVSLYWNFLRRLMFARDWRDWLWLAATGSTAGFARD